MAFTIVDGDGDTVLTGATPLDLTNAGTYYLKRLKVGAPNRKIAIDSSPSAKGSFVQDFDDHSYPIMGGSLAIVGSSEAAVKATFESYALLIKSQIDLTLTIPNETGTYPNCVNMEFDLIRFPGNNQNGGQLVKPNDNGTFRAYVQMDFIQLSK